MPVLEAVRNKRRIRQRVWADQRFARGVCRSCDRKVFKFRYCQDCRILRADKQRRNKT